MLDVGLSGRTHILLKKINKQNSQKQILNHFKFSAVVFGLGTDDTGKCCFSGKSEFELSLL